MSTSLAKNEPVAVLAQLRSNPMTAIIEQYDQLAAVANVTFPSTALDNLPPMHKPSPSIVRVDKNPQSKDTYNIGGGQMGLSKHVVYKMLTAAGISWDSTKLTPDSDLNYIRWQARVWRKLPDGAIQTGQGSKAWSWEKCQEQMKPEQARQYRQFADEQTETKAILRAARAMLNIKTSYTAAELEKPFLFLRVVPDLDLSDPDIKRALAQKLIDSSFAIYGQPDAAPTLPPASFPALPAEPTEEEFDDSDFTQGEYAEAEIVDDSARNSGPAAEMELDYDPFKVDEAPAQTPEQELDAALVDLAKRVGSRVFPILLQRQSIQHIRAASFDQKLMIKEEAQAVLEGRLSL